MEQPFRNHLGGYCILDVFSSPLAYEIILFVYESISFKKGVRGAIQIMNRAVT
jgi:hypothetical protein